MADNIIYILNGSDLENISGLYLFIYLIFLKPFWRLVIFFNHKTLSKGIKVVSFYIYLFICIKEYLSILFVSCFLLQAVSDWSGRSLATLTQWPGPGRYINDKCNAQKILLLLSKCEIIFVTH